MCHKLSVCDVTSGNVSFFASRKGGTGGGGWVHPNGTNSMAASIAVESLGQHWMGHFSPRFHK